MNCLFCQGAMKQGTAPVRIERKGYYLSFDAVPALICEQCGEVYFEEREVAKIQEIITNIDEQTVVFSRPNTAQAA